MAIFSIQHITRYEYSRPVRESSNQIKIHPYSCSTQEVLQHDVRITGNPDLHLFPDYWGNRTGIFTVAEPHTHLTIESRLLIRTLNSDLTAFDAMVQKDEIIPENDLLLTELKQPELIRRKDAIDFIATEVYDESKNIPQIISHCSHYIFQNFRYIKGITDYETTVDEILEHQSGVCQDFAHVLLQLLRSLGIPCRYVSGYICPNKNGMRGEGATHAWVEAWVPGYGWAGIDPTNNVWVQHNHVKLAVGRNFNDCTPVKGTFKGTARQHMSVFVSVGYEDGHVFEAQTDVSSETAPFTGANEPEFIPGVDQQQQ
ncbi:MAG TPA: transglutaminase family protein [Lacibacter sp.]|nr:transglutaminase family protein [Lacibacter sp.]